MLWSLNRELSFIEALQANPTMKVPGLFDYVSDLKIRLKQYQKIQLIKLKLKLLD